MSTEREFFLNMEQNADRNIFGMGNKVYKIKGVHGYKYKRQLCDNGEGHLLMLPTEGLFRIFLQRAMENV